MGFCTINKAIFIVFSRLKMSNLSNDSAACSGEGVANDCPVSSSFAEAAASDLPVVAEIVWTKENSIDSETETTPVKSEHDHIEPTIPLEPLKDPLAEVEASDDIELQNVLDLENVLKTMHESGAGLGLSEDGDKSFPLENELERVMRLENVLRKVNGNLSEFKLVEEALRKIPETVTLDDAEDDSSEMNLGTRQMSDMELALQNEPLLLNEDYRESFSTIEEWASSQLKQQESTNSLPKDGSFTLKSEREVMKSAKILFAKKTKTLFRWLHPRDSKADLRQRVDRAWDSLSPNEIEFYYSQVLGPFNHRQVKPMINPRIFELLNIPEGLRPDPSTCPDADAHAVADTASQSTPELPKTARVSRIRKPPKPKDPTVAIPRRKRGPYKKTLQSQENSRIKEKRRKRNSSTSSGSDFEYVPNASTKRRRETKKKKVTKMSKLRLKFFKMKTTRLPASSESDDFDEDEDDSDLASPYKRRFGGVTEHQDAEISAELSRGLEECDKLLDSDNSM